MGRRLGQIACAVALAAASLCAAPASAQDPGPPYGDWNAKEPGFPSNAPASARATCRTSSRACINRTIAEMIRRFNTVVPRCDGNSIFSLTYLRVTEDIRNGLDGGFYADPAWLNRLDALFARPYFLTYDNWAAGRTALVPPAWRIAFDAGRDGTVGGIGNLLLSMSAHVNRDFPFVLYRAGLVDGDGISHKQEHDNGNIRLRALFKPMIDELTRRFDPSIDDFDLPGTADDEVMFSVLVDWRETAWQNAQRLAAATSDAERRAVAASIEQYALDQANLLYATFAYGPGETTAARDAQCAADGGQDPGYRRGADVARATGGPARVSERGTTFAARCPDGPGPCVGVASIGDARKRFTIAAGGRRTIRVSGSGAAAAGDGRIRVRLISKLEPGLEVTRTRLLRAR